MFEDNYCRAELVQTFGPRRIYSPEVDSSRVMSFQLDNGLIWTIRSAYIQRLLVKVTKNVIGQSAL